MLHKITSEDNWLVQCLFLASFGAALFFGVSSGWLASLLGVTQVSANVYSSTMATAPVAPVLVYETNAQKIDKKVENNASAEVSNIMLSGIDEGQSVTGIQYITVLPKHLAKISKIELRLNGQLQTPKEPGSATYAIDTAPLPEGTHTIVVDVRGVANDEEISLQKNVTFKVVNKTEVVKKPIDTETYTTYKKPADTNALQLKQGGAFVMTDRINVRSEPNGVIIAQQNIGARAVQVADVAVAQGEYKWLLVEFTGGLKGYVATDFLRQASDEVAYNPTNEKVVVDVVALQAQVAALQKQLADIQAQLKALLE